MSFDGIVINALCHELNSVLLNGRIDKIYQPENDELIINIRSKGENYKLLISASNNNPRFYITNITKMNPQNPPMFCMLLRKHLQGGRIVGINQIFMERILSIDIQNLNELGDITTKQLVIEIMGRHSNIILIDKTTQKIIDSIKRIGHEVSSVRQVLPGFEYKLPPSQDKLNPLDITRSGFFEKINSFNSTTPVYKFLYKTFMGLSPLVAREICYKSKIDDDSIIESLSEDNKEDLYFNFAKLMNEAKNNNFTPCIVIDKYSKRIIAFSSVEIKQYGNMEIKYYDSISRVVDEYYATKDKKDRLKQRSSDLLKLLNNKLERSQNKLAKQKEELLSANDKEKYKIYGDLITANIYRIDKTDEIELENFYSPDLEKIVIKLDPRLTPAQNAQKYYKKYNKLKNAAEVVAKQITKTKEEIDYLENVIVNIKNCTEPEELEEIKEELMNEGYLKVKKKNNINKNKVMSKPRHYISREGFDIYVGKNNRQNDFLTLKFADKNDIWLHTKEIPGSHVIIKTNGKEVPDSTIEEAALLAAFYSKGNMSSNVPVDYTERKNVKKPSKSKPGMVIYDNYNTIYVTPKTEKINNIKKVEE